VSLDKSNAGRRHHNKGKQYEKEIDLPAAGSVRRKKQEHFGNRALCAFRGERTCFDLAICGATQRPTFGQGWNNARGAGRGANCLVKQGPFDNE
jgi:hypothetical protein